MKVVGSVMNASVSLADIQMKRGDSSSGLPTRPALTKCQRSTPSAVAQPTHDPVAPWSLIFHQAARRSLLAGIAGAAATMSAAAACSNVQSSSTFGDGLQLRIRLTRRVVARRVVALRFGAGMALPPVGTWRPQPPIPRSAVAAMQAFLHGLGGPKCCESDARGWTDVQPSPHQPDLERVGALAVGVAGAVEQAEDARDVGLRLGNRRDAAAGVDADGARVVGGQRERDRAEGTQEVAHQVRLGVDGALGIERVVEAIGGGGAR